MTATSVRTIKVLHSANGKSVWRFCSTSDGGYLARKNGWQDVKSFRSWNQMLFQYNRWLEYTTQGGVKTFAPGYPRKAEASAPAQQELELTPETMSPEDIELAGLL